MANEIYHRSNWGNAVNDIAWGDVYEKFDATNEMFVRSDNYENSNETDKLMAAINPKPSILLTPTAYDNGSLHSVKPVRQEVLLQSVSSINGWVDARDTSNLSIENNNIRATRSDADAATIGVSSSGFATVIGKVYELKLNATKNNSNGLLFVRVSNDQQLSSVVFNSSIASTSISVNTTFTATAEISYVGILATEQQGSNYIEASLMSVNNKGADFDFTRGTIATRVNEQGLIEDVTDTNLPRINYLGGTGHLLLEPQSTNTATYSNDFTQGDIFNSSGNPFLQNATLTANQVTSPDGTNNASLLQDNSGGGTGLSELRFNSVNVTSNDFNTVAIFVKKALTNNFFSLASLNYDSSGSGASWFNISNGTLGTIDSNHTAKIEDYGNGWYRCQITFKTTTDVGGGVRIRLADTDGSTNVTLDGTNGVYLYGLQCEASATQNFATSYIPTSGSTVTRNADVCNNAGSSDLINSTEGVLYAEITALVNDSSVREISLSDGTANNRIELRYGAASNRLQLVARSSGSVQASISNSDYNILLSNKIAVKYKANDFALWINGVKVGTDTSGNAPSGLSELAFDDGNGTSDFYGKVKSVAVYKEALTDAQLTALTT